MNQALTQHYLQKLFIQFTYRYGLFHFWSSCQIFKQGLQTYEKAIQHNALTIIKCCLTKNFFFAISLIAVELFKISDVQNNFAANLNQLRRIRSI